MADTVRAICYKCRTEQNATELEGAAFEAAKQDAQCPADYFLMDEHDDPRTQFRCEGSGKTPDSLIEDEEYGDDGNYLELGDIAEDFGDEGLVLDEHYFADIDELPDRSGDGHELDIYGPKIYD